MPVYDTINNEREPTKRYKWNMFTDPTTQQNIMLRVLRSYYNQDQQYFGELQKLFGRNDPQAAKLMKEYASDALKMSRAITFIIPWLGEPDKNQTVCNPEFFPLELAEELDFITAMVNNLDILRKHIESFQYFWEKIFIDKFVNSEKEFPDYCSIIYWNCKES